MGYSIQKPDDQDCGTWFETKKECIDYLVKSYSPEEIDEMNAAAEYHGWQLAENDGESDYVTGVIEVCGDDLR